MKNIVVFPAPSRFLAKLICCIAFRSASRAWSMALLLALFSQALRFHPCAAASIDYLLQLLQMTG